MKEKIKNGVGGLKNKLSTREAKEKRFWLCLISPALIICTIFILIPVIDSVIMSFTEYKLVNLVYDIPGEWNNFENYTRLFSAGKLQESTWVTVFFVFWVTVITFVVGMILALILNSKLRGARIWRSIMMIPWVVPTVIGALLWSWIYSSPYGLLKYLVEFFSGGEITGFSMLSSKDTALWGVIIVALWKQIPLMTLLLLAGLQSVPDDIMEAASVDGATGITKLVKIVLPQVKSVIKISISMCMIENFKQYPLFAALTNGGQGTTSLALLSYEEAFVSNNFGSGAAVTTIWMILMIAVILVYNRLFREN